MIASHERYGVIMRTWPPQGRTSPTGRAGFSSDAAAALIARAAPQPAPEQAQVIADDAGDHSGGGGGGGDDDDDGSPARMSFRRSNRGHTSVEAVDVVEVVEIVEQVPATLAFGPPTVSVWSTDRERFAYRAARHSKRSGARCRSRSSEKKGGAPR